MALASGSSAVCPKGSTDATVVSSMNTRPADGQRGTSKPGMSPQVLLSLLSGSERTIQVWDLTSQESYLTGCHPGHQRRTSPKCLEFQSLSAPDLPQLSRAAFGRSSSSAAEESPGTPEVPRSSRTRRRRPRARCEPPGP